MIPEIITTVFEHTSTPAPRHIKEAYNILKQRTETNTVSIDGQSHSLSPTTIAAKEAMYEADRRYNEYRTQTLQDVAVSVMRLGDKAYAVLQLPTDYPLSLLSGYVAKVPKAPGMERAG
jgi:hypothetical protein